MDIKTISTMNRGSIAIDHWTEDETNDSVWMNVTQARSSMSFMLTKDQARELAATLIEYAEAK